MALRTQNPFRFGDPVQGDYFMPLPALKDKQILDEGSARGVVVFDDPLFAIWLRFEFAD